MGTALGYLAAAAAPAITLFAPGAVAWLVAHETGYQMITCAPLLAMLLLSFLAWRLNQARILGTAIAVAAAYGLLRWPGSPVFAALAGGHAAETAGVALPLALTFSFIVREGPVLGSRNAWRTGLVLLPFVFLGALGRIAPAPCAALMEWRIPALGPGVAFPHLAVVSVLLFLLVAVIIRDLRLKGFLAALAIALMPALLAVHAAVRSPHPGDAAPVAAASFVSVSVILLHAIFAMYWQRVYVDELTGISNRRALDERLHGLSGPYAVAMLDIDHFKSFNDTYGHEEGDNVLRLVAKHLRGEFGSGAYRYGGEEFCGVFEGVNAAAAFDFVNGARERLAGRRFHVRSATPRRKSDASAAPDGAEAPPGAVRITMSAGVAAPRTGGDSPASVIQRADAALYKAKAAGRNQVAAG